MSKGINILSLIPVKLEPSHRSEMVSQLLFGETYTINDKSGDWLHITGDEDNYEGWILSGQSMELSESEYEHINNQKILCTEPFYQSIGVTRSLNLFMGSRLTFFTNNQFSLLGENYPYYGKLSNIANSDKAERLKEIALSMLHAPYLWGGRTIAGIDCSGYSQLVYKCIGISLKRDAYQQAGMGEDVYFIYEAKIGDLAFFENEEGSIVHVGILLNNHQIIHAHGRIRMDSIDQQGIYDNERKKYTHKLRLIKRILTDDLA